MAVDQDRIEKQIVLKAPRARVWRAIADWQQFGAWFGVALEGPFVAGQTARGRITHPDYQHLTMTMDVVRVEPERCFAFRWHPYAIDDRVDYAQEPTTLVELTLAEASGGTQLTIVESGFGALPESRRDLAFRMNDGGWSAQCRNLERHVA